MARGCISCSRSRCLQSITGYKAGIPGAWKHLAWEDLRRFNAKIEGTCRLLQPLGTCGELMLLEHDREIFAVSNPCALLIWTESNEDNYQTKNHIRTQFPQHWLTGLSRLSFMICEPSSSLQARAERTFCPHI